MCSGKAFSDTELSVYKKMFLEYCVLGGMPAVIRQYIETNTFSDTLEIQHQIQLDYEEDIRKYAEGLDQTKIASVVKLIKTQEAESIRAVLTGLRMRELFLSATVWNIRNCR